MLKKTKALTLACLAAIAMTPFVAIADSFSQNTKKTETTPVPLKVKSPLRALYYVYSAESNDYFYSINKNDINAAIQYYGYDDLPGQIGTIGYVEALHRTHTLPLQRFYKGQPETDHFYTTDQSEVDYVIAHGWNFEGGEGNLYTYQVPGTVPVYRLNKWNSKTGDLVHYFATEQSDIQAKLEQGYANDGIKGYIYTSVTQDYAPAVTNGRILGRRCDYSKMVEPRYGCNMGMPNSRDDYFNQGFNQPSSVPYFWLNSTHFVNFEYISYDWSPRTGHQDIMLRNSVNYDVNDVTWGSFDGVGLIFGGFDHCLGAVDSSYNRVIVEIWRPTADNRSTEAYVDCSTYSKATLQNGVKYKFFIRSTNTGQFCYQIRQDSTIVEPERCFDVKHKYEYMHLYTGGTERFVPYPIPNFSTGANTHYTLVHANDAKDDFTSYFLNINSYWQ